MSHRWKALFILCLLLASASRTTASERIDFAHQLSSDSLPLDTVVQRPLLASEDSENPIGDILPRSPQAATIARYGEWPVSMATGVPDISILIYTIRLGAFELPVRLSYHASGIRVNDVASTVGLGWTLDAGGCISRTVCGAPDHTGADDTYQDQDAMERLIGGASATDEGTATLDDLLGNTPSSTARQFGYDCLSDRYTYNFCGQTGTFRRSTDDGSYMPLDYSRMLIEAQGADCQGGSSSFRIVGTDGIEYTFAQQEQTGVASDENTTDVTAWYLTCISTPWGDIDIEYSMAAAYRLTTVTETATTGYFGEYVPPQGGDAGYCHYKDKTRYNCHATRLLFRSPVPTRISWGGGNAVVFSYADDREDIWPTRLTAVTVVNNEGDTVRTAKPDNAHYWGDEGARRMLLRGLSLSGEGRYAMDYDTSGSLPPYLTFEKTESTTFGPSWAVTDFWGYYTGQKAKSLIPRAAYSNVLTNYKPTDSWSGDDKLPLDKFADRTPVERFTKLGSLTAVTFPTGGITRLELEQNGLGVGGLRVRSIATYDRDGSLLLKKDYTYDPLLRTTRPTSETTINSDGRRHTTEYTYAFESADTLHQRMVDECNLYDTRITTRTLCDSTLLTETRTSYRLVQPRGFFLPALISRSRLGSEEHELWRFDAYGENGNLLKLVAHGCDTTDIAWDATATVPLSYSVNGRRKASYTWKPLVGVISITTENGYTTAYGYDGAGRLASISDLQGTRQTFAYDCIGRADETAGEANIVKITSYLSASGDNTNTAVGYHDGIGRPYLTATNAKGTCGDFVYTLTEYDRQGCEDVSWLPVVGDAVVTELPKDSIAVLSQQTYWDYHAYATVHHDGLGRTILTETAGDAWYAAAKGKTTERVTNGKRDVKHYAAPLTENSQQKCGYYEAASLYGTKTTDEDGHTLTVFTDKLGRKILERRSKDNDTYFVYDDLGQLRFVLSPSYQEAGYKDKYAYEYRYDDRGNIVKKILPQCEATQYWYDRANRQTFSQDGLLRERGRYRFHLYDNQGRLAVEGTCTSCNRSLKGAIAHPVATPGKGEGIGGSGYTISCDLQMENVELELVNYYDGYAFERGAHKAEFAPLGTGENGADATGLLTGSITKASNGEWLYAIHSYDDRGQLVRTTNTTLDGGIEHTVTSYTFTGKAERTSHRLIMNGTELLTDVQSSTYTHFSDKLQDVTLSVATAGRKKETRKVATIRYSSLGQLEKVDYALGVEGMGYSYDIHGRVDLVSSLSACERLFFATPPVGTPCYNGDISFMTWDDENIVKMHSYRFTYDALDRLTDATYGDGCICPYEEFKNNANRYNEKVLAYTANGAIKRLQRRGLKQNGEYGKIDNLNITLDGNRPVKVVDDAEPLYYDGAFDFEDDDNSEDVEYTYNAVGALTSDRNRGITNIEYDDRGNTRRIHFADGNTTEYVYSVTGEKLRTIHGSDSTDYIGCLVMRGGQPSVYFFDGGYVSFEPDDSTAFHYFNYDHLGNIRGVLNARDKVEQAINYYPFGTPYSGNGSGIVNTDFLPYKLSGKELDERNGLRTYDFGARQYNPLLGVWDRPDRFAERYYHLSPYAYCGNSPVMAVDVNGDSLHVNSADWNIFQNSLTEVFGDVANNFCLSNNGMLLYSGTTECLNKNQRKLFAGLQAVMLSKVTTNVEYGETKIIEGKNGDLRTMDARDGGGEATVTISDSPDLLDENTILVNPAITTLHISELTEDYLQKLNGNGWNSTASSNEFNCVE